MRKITLLLIMFCLIYLTGCDYLIKDDPKEKTTPTTETKEMTTSTASTIPAIQTNFTEMYQNTLDQWINSNGFSYSINYSLKVSNTTTESSTTVLVDNQSKNMQMTSTVKTDILGSDSTVTEDPMYISYINGVLYSFIKIEENYVKNEMVDQEVFDIDYTDIFSGLNISELDVQKVDPYTFRLNLPYSRFTEGPVAMDDMFSEFGVDLAFLSDISIPVKYTFNPETQLLHTIELDMTTFVRSLYNKLFPGTDFGTVDMKLTFQPNQFNGVTVNNPYINDAILDDAPNMVLDFSYKIPKYELGNINCQFDYLYDTDVYELNVSESGKYIIKFTENDLPVEIQLYDHKGNLLTNATTEYLYDSLTTQNPVAYDLSIGTYYISVTNYETDFSNNPIIMFEKVEQDDYADGFNEISYPVKQLNNSQNFSGNINYLGDVDVFSVSRGTNDIVHIKVKTDELFITAKIVDGFMEYQTYEPVNGVYDFYLNGNDLSTTYLILSSNTSLSSYEIEVNYFGTAQDEGNSIHDEHLNTIQVGEEYEGAFLLNDKMDAYQVVITEAGYYNFAYSVTNLEEGRHNTISVSLYNTNKQLIEVINGMYSYYLEPGTYYIQVKYDYGFYCTYFIDITRGIDEIYDEHITLSDSNEIKVSSDYSNDTDSYFFTITESTFYLLNYQSDDYGRTQVVIKDEQGVVVYDGYFERGYYISDDLYIYLIPGQYSLEITGQYWGDFTILLDKTTVPTDDYPSATSIESAMGVLQEGMNTIKLDYRVDQDMYVFEAKFDGTYYIKHNFNSWHSFAGFVSFTDSNGTVYNLDEMTNRLELTKGKYYFKFKFDKASEQTITIFYYDEHVVDEGTRTMNLSNNTVSYSGNINYINDIDEFQITIAEDGLLKIVKDPIYYTINFKLLDSENNVIAFNDSTFTVSRDGFSYWGHTIYANIKAGTYTLKVDDTYLEKYPYNFTFTHDTNVSDDYSDNFEGTSFGTLNYGENLIQIDYPSDVDIFTFTVEEGKGSYFFFENNVDYIGVYDLELKRLTYQDNAIGFAPALKSGTYYVVVYSSYKNDYKLNIRSYN